MSDHSSRSGGKAGEPMRVSIFGLGYVGSVLAACLCRDGHEVVGVDLNPRKVAAVEEGRPPVEEPGVEERLAPGVEEGRVWATTDADEAVAETDVSFLAVGTPQDETGQLTTTNLYNVMDAAVPGLEGKADPESGEVDHTFVVRSTVPPRTTRNLRSYLQSSLDERGISAEVDFLVNPEFLREGTAIDDFYHPPYVVVGAFEESNPKLLLDLYESLDVQADIEVVRPELAESLKLVNNAFHALKICFANEVGSLASELGFDGKELMELVCADTKLNVSPAYLEPGFAYGGACLPKDTRALATLGEETGLSVPLLGTIPTSNEHHLNRVAEVVDDLDTRQIGIAGISFKSGTTDMRNSPGLRLARSMDSEPVLYAAGVEISELIGSNRDYFDKALPDAESHLIEDSEQFLDRADAVVFANDGSFPELFPRITSKPVVDPVGAVRERADEFEAYHSVTW